jgi:hypothetical protein
MNLRQVGCVNYGPVAQERDNKILLRRDEQFVNQLRKFNEVIALARI